MGFFIFDLDGTLALVEHRRHFVQGNRKDHRAFYEACDLDPPNLPVIAALNAHIAAGHRVEIWSGRSDEVRDKTVAWLAKHGIDPSLLKHMRAAGDFTKDHVLKAQWLHACDAKPDAVYDDRGSVVSLAWRANGVPCFQVAPDWETPAEDVVLLPNGEPQKLILLVGPSGAGKTEYAKQFPSSWVISSDDMRVKLCGSLQDQSRNDDVFLAVRRLARARLMCGFSVVIDATHLRRKTRVEHAKLAPVGIEVEYHVIDRPLVDKVRDGAWRNDVMIELSPDRTLTLIEKHDQHFQSEIKNILLGDKLSNVKVFDLRGYLEAAAA